MQNLIHIVPVLIFTGTGYLASLLFADYIVTLDKRNFDQLALLESVYILLNTLLSLGITQLYSSKISRSKENECELIIESRTLKFYLSLLISFSSFYWYVDNFELFLLVLFCPLYSLNLDYVLYSTGRPVKASVVSFCRITIPFVLFVFISDKSSQNFLVCLILGGGLSSIISIAVMKQKLFFKLAKLTKCKLKNVIKIGTTSSIYGGYRDFIVPCLIFFNVTHLEEYFTFFKLYFIAIGLRRIVIQTFYKQIANGNIKVVNFNTSMALVCLYITMFGGLYLVTLLGYFDSLDLKTWLMLGLLCFALSVMPTAMTQLIHKNQISTYNTLALLSPIFAIALLPLAFAGLNFYIMVLIFFESLIQYVAWHKLKHSQNNPKTITY